MNSRLSGVPRMPYAGSLTETPSMTNWFSGDVVPLTPTPYVSAFAPGTVSATDSNERAAEPFALGGTTGTCEVKSLPTWWVVELDPTSTEGGSSTTTTSFPRIV